MLNRRRLGHTSMLQVMLKIEEIEDSREAIKILFIYLFLFWSRILNLSYVVKNLNASVDSGCNCWWYENTIVVKE